MRTIALLCLGLALAGAAGAAPAANRIVVEPPASPAYEFCFEGRCGGALIVLCEAVVEKVGDVDPRTAAAGPTCDGILPFLKAVREFVCTTYPPACQPVTPV